MTFIGSSLEGGSACGGERVTLCCTGAVGRLGGVTSGIRWVPCAGAAEVAAVAAVVADAATAAAASGAAAMVAAAD